MPIYDKITLGKRAKELGFTRDTFEKMCRLTDILQYLGGEPRLSNSLALKGGTAINLTVFNLPRLSVDIDLDFAENLSKEATMERRNRINEMLSKHMKAEGYVQKAKTKETHALDSFVYSYQNAAGNADNIKIEINYVLRSHVLPIMQNTIQAGDIFSAFSVNTLSPIEIFAGKIVAMASRAAARDLYDINNMIYYGLFDESELTMLRKCTVFYMAIAGDKKTDILHFDKMEQITPKVIRTDLYPMIRNVERFDIATAKSRVLEFLERLMVMEEQEKTFIKRFSEGYYKPDLLFDEPEILERIKCHPMAQWRVQKNKSELER